MLAEDEAGHGRMGRVLGPGEAGRAGRYLDPAGECAESGLGAGRDGYPEVAEAYTRIAYEEAEHAAKFAEMLGEVVMPDTKSNLSARVEAEFGACSGKKELAGLAKKHNLDAIHDTVHEMCKDEARHGRAFKGLLDRYFTK